MIRSIMLGLWLFAVAFVIYVISVQDRFFAVETTPIAYLIESNGPVSTRPLGIMRWNAGIKGQGLQDGDYVATGRDGSAKVAFSNSQALVLGESTQIQISGIQRGNKDFTFHVSLQRGAVVAATAPECKGKDCAGKGAKGGESAKGGFGFLQGVAGAERPNTGFAAKSMAAAGAPGVSLIVKAGGQQFNVDAGKELGVVVKEAGKPATRFDPKLPLPPTTAPAPLALVTKSFLEPVVAPPPKADPPPPPPPKPAARPAPKPAPPPKVAPTPPMEEVKGKEADIALPGAGRAWWTLKPIRELGAAYVEVPVIVPPVATTKGQAQQAIELSGSGTPLLVGVTPQDKVLKLPVAKFAQVGKPSRGGGYTEYEVTARGGIIWDVDGKRAQSMRDRKVSLRIRSYGDAGTGAVSLALDRFQPGNAPDLFEPKTELKAGDGALRIRLALAQDLGRFRTFMAGAGAFGVGREAIDNGESIYVVRGNMIVAEVSGSLARQAAGQVMKVLGGSLVFKGSRSAFYDTSGKTKGAVVDLVGALLDKGKVLYILKRNKIYPVSRDFIKTNKEVGKFIDTQAKAVFLEKVEIVDYR